ncbi:MAG: Dps family protein [Porphyromonas sp.]|nr:Dps family protein [Porphyromonas sp.]
MKTTNYLHLNEAYAVSAVEKLNKLTANFHVYYSNLRAFHWHVEGSSFFVLHEQLEKMYDGLAENIDEVAERILQLGGTPVRLFKDIESLATLKQAEKVSKESDIVEQVLESISLFIKLEREILALAAENGDDTTVGLISEYLKDQEKLVWMLTAYLKK